MEITPELLTAARLAEITEARKFIKWSLMHTISMLAECNAENPLKPMKPELAGAITKFCEDLQTLDDLRDDYAKKQGIFKDYIL